MSRVSCTGMHAARTSTLMHAHAWVERERQHVHTHTGTHAHACACDRHARTHACACVRTRDKLCSAKLRRATRAVSGRGARSDGENDVRWRRNQRRRLDPASGGEKCNPSSASPRWRLLLRSACSASKSAPTRAWNRVVPHTVYQAGRAGLRDTYLWRMRARRARRACVHTVQCCAVIGRSTAAGAAGVV